MHKCTIKALLFSKRNLNRGACFAKRVLIFMTNDRFRREFQGNSMQMRNKNIAFLDLLEVFFKQKTILCCIYKMQDRNAFLVKVFQIFPSFSLISIWIFVNYVRIDYDLHLGPMIPIKYMQIKLSAMIYWSNMRMFRNKDKRNSSIPRLVIKKDCSVMRIAAKKTNWILYI